MNELKIFEHPRFGKIRTIVEDGKTLFCGKDAALALSYKDTDDAIRRHCRYPAKHRVPHPQNFDKTIVMTFITDGDLCRLAAKSEMPGADEFESWIFDEVVPAVLRNGGYVFGQESMTPEELMASALTMAQKVLAERETRLSELTVENQLMKPKADYFDELVSRNLLTNFRETAKQLEIKPRTFVTEILRQKYIYRDQRGKLMPYQNHVDDGLFEVKECYSEKTTWSGTQTLVTPKGRETFRLLFPCKGRSAKRR